MKFIVLCGLDGCGKSTQARLLGRWLRENGYRVRVTQEPTNGEVGKLIRKILRSRRNVPQLMLQLLFAADRHEHLVKIIEPSLRRGYVVISDRYILSSLAYGALDVPLKLLKQINSSFRIPDLTIFIDASPRTCLERLKKGRRHVELFEREEMLRRVRRNYLKLLKYHPNTHLVDGNGSIDEVFSEIKDVVSKALGLNESYSQAPFNDP